MKLQKTYVITGGTGSIGVAICRQLLENGHRVIPVYKQDVVKANKQLIGSN